MNNIDRLFFRRNGQLKTEFDELYKAIFSNPGRYIEIVRLLSENKQGMTLDEVAKKTGIDGKRLTTVLRNPERSDILLTYKQFGNKSRGTLYPLVDLYTPFFYKFVQAHDDKDEQWWMHNYPTRSVESWQATSFPLVCITHLPQIKRAMGISGNLNQLILLALCSSSFHQTEAEHPFGGINTPLAIATCGGIYIDASACPELSRRVEIKESGSDVPEPRDL